MYENLIVLPDQPAEHFYGNKEYKITLNFKKKNLKQIFEKKASQMLFRLNEGNGKAVYLIGVEDNGVCRGIPVKELEKSLENLKKISSIIESQIKNINFYKGSEGFIAAIRLIKNLDNLFLL